MHPTHKPTTTPAIEPVPEPVSEPATSERMTPNRLLRDAAAYLSRHGWITGRLYTNHTDAFPPACLMGAIGMVVTGSPASYAVDDRFDTCDPMTRHIVRWALYDLVDLLDINPETGHLGDVINELTDWNDATGRTAADVIDALHQAAGITATSIRGGAA